MRTVQASSLHAAVAFTLLGGAALLLPPPARAQLVIAAGEVRGRLEQTDPGANARLFDEYRYRGVGGEHLTITLRSGAFDSSLLLLDGAGNVVRRNDDDGRSVHSRIDFVLPDAGTYVIRASSSSTGATGAYVLAVSTNRRPPGQGVPVRPSPRPAPVPDTIRIEHIADGWTYIETVGKPGSTYFCVHYGLLFVQGQGASFGVRFQQKGECTIAGATRSSAGVFGAAGTPLVQPGLPPGSIRFTIDTCVYTGALCPDWRLRGTLRCIVRMPDGTETPVVGAWMAERP